MSDLLRDVVAALLAGNVRDWVELERGLIIAYTPPADGGPRLTLSRRQGEPSETEADVVGKRLAAVLGERGYSTWFEKSFETIKERPCWVLRWTDGRQLSLFESADERPKGYTE